MKHRLAVAIFALVSLLWPHVVAAADEKWVVAEVSGTATAIAPLGSPHPLVIGETLAPGSTLTTGAGGRIVFGDGKTVITMSPNSRLITPADSSDAMTRFTQDMGSVFFKVEKRPLQHFEVQTPMLAAVVKGTQFTVNADDLADAVAVTEGLVAVIATHGGATVMVPAGHSATVHHSAPEKLSAADAASGAITQDIGNEPLNYATVTAGLIQNTQSLQVAVSLAPTDPSATGGSANDGNANGGSGNGGNGNNGNGPGNGNNGNGNGNSGGNGSNGNGPGNGNDDGPGNGNGNNGNGNGNGGGNGSNGNGPGNGNGDGPGNGNGNNGNGNGNGGGNGSNGNGPGNGNGDGPGNGNGNGGGNGSNGNGNGPPGNGHGRGKGG